LDLHDLNKVILALPKPQEREGLMTKTLEIPYVNLEEEELRLALAIRLLEEGKVSLGKAAEIGGLSERSFAELLLKKGISPVGFEDIDLEKESQNA